MAVLIPHLKVPFNMTAAGTRAQVVEEDSEDEIRQCVLAILRTRYGQRSIDEEIGIPDYAFSQSDENFSQILRTIETYEPRAIANLTVEEIEDLTRLVRVDYSDRSESAV